MPDRSLPPICAVSSSGDWRPVAIGLRIKLIALPLIIAGPFVLLTAVLRGWPLWIGLITISIGLLVDCCGRCWCAAATMPLARKVWLYGSILCQVIELLLLAACWAIHADVELLYWLFAAAAALHLVTAFLFTQFMRVALPISADSDAVHQQIQTLVGSLLGVMGAGSGVALAGVFVAVVTFVVAIFTCGFGWLIAVPLAVVFIVPCLLALVGTLVFLCVQYVQSVWSLSASLLRFESADLPKNRLAANLPPAKQMD